MHPSKLLKKSSSYCQHIQSVSNSHCWQPNKAIGGQQIHFLCYVSDNGVEYVWLLASTYVTTWMLIHCSPMRKRCSAIAWKQCEDGRLIKASVSGLSSPADALAGAPNMLSLPRRFWKRKPHSNPANIGSASAGDWLVTLYGGDPSPRTTMRPICGAEANYEPNASRISSNTIEESMFHKIFPQLKPPENLFQYQLSNAGCTYLSIAALLSKGHWNEPRVEISTRLFALVNAYVNSSCATKRTTVLSSILSGQTPHTRL